VADSTHIYMVGEYGGYPSPKKNQAIVMASKNNLSRTQILFDSIEGNVKFLSHHGHFLYVITKGGNYYKLLKIHKQSGKAKLLLKKSISISNVTTFNFENDSTIYIVFASVNSNLPTEIYYTANSGETWSFWQIPLMVTRSIIKQDTLYLLSHKGINGQLNIVDYKKGNYIKVIKFNEDIFDMKLNPVNGKILLSGYKNAEHGWSKFWRKKVVSVYELRNLKPVKISGFMGSEKMLPHFLYVYGNFICVSYGKFEDDFFGYSFDYGGTWHKNKIPRIYDESYDFYKDKEFYGTIDPQDFMAGKFYKDID